MAKAPACIPLDAKLQKELQRTAAVVSYNFICTGSKGMTLANQYSALSIRFHGDGADIVSQIRNLSNGEQMYAKAFESVTVSITDKDDKAGSSRLKLKSIFSCEPKKTYYCGEDFKLEYLSLKARKLDSGLIVGRNIFDMAKLVIKNVKKAMAFGKEFVQKKGNNDDDWTLSSGMTLDDLVEHVLSQMYDWENKITRDGETDSTVDSDVEQEGVHGQKPVTHPPGYYFPGYFAFILFGKFNYLPSLRLECFAKDDELGSKKTCKAAHAKEAKEAGNKKIKSAIDNNEAENIAKSDTAGSIVIVGGKDNEDMAILMQSTSHLNCRNGRSC